MFPPWIILAEIRLARCQKPSGVAWCLLACARLSSHISHSPWILLHRSQTGSSSSVFKFPSRREAAAYWWLNKSSCSILNALSLFKVGDWKLWKLRLISIELCLSRIQLIVFPMESLFCRSRCLLVWTEKLQKKVDYYSNNNIQVGRRKSSMSAQLVFRLNPLNEQIVVPFRKTIWIGFFLNKNHCISRTHVWHPFDSVTHPLTHSRPGARHCNADVSPGTTQSCESKAKE